ncbi:universal stress protein [Natronococcus sp. A-GB7]|uniref:universal stress protein n=1 Tax=Natronococcus sp. A-GB7 TaxID=3037649 RepID=UPI00241D0EB0|nr:universal stress protein [Natronococcus sp. A-GB7]MDG5820939.1 universal stress protein [Natronococcus sp. A-GB7]
MYDSVLIPTDGRENTDRAIDEAIDLARVHGSTVHALYVVNSAAIAPGVDFEDLEVAGGEAVDYVATRAADAGLEDVRTTVTHGLRHKAILQYADEHDVDLIVMGRNRGLDRFLRKSVSERVATDSTRPVLVVE